jgi:hypothetical protein
VYDDSQIQYEEILAAGRAMTDAAMSALTASLN